LCFFAVSRPVTVEPQFQLTNVEDGTQQNELNTSQPAENIMSTTGKKILLKRMCVQFTKQIINTYLCL